VSLDLYNSCHFMEI